MCLCPWEPDALHFVYALGYHEMYFRNAYDSLHSFNQDYCHDYYFLKEGMRELCLRMVNSIKGTCILNHSVKNIYQSKECIIVDGYEGKKVIVTIPPSLFKNFPILSPYSFNLSDILLLRIYVKYEVPAWFDSLD